MKRFKLLLLLAVAGCGQSPSKPPVVSNDPPETPKLVLPDSPNTTSPVSAKVPEPQPPAASATPGVVPLPYPSDKAGQLVQNAMTPNPPPASLFKPQTTPKARSSDVDRGELGMGKVTAKLPEMPSINKTPPVRLAPPPERVNADLSQAILLDPSTIKLTPSIPTIRPIPSVVRLGADDLPGLARRLDDRATLDDPTAELSASRIVNTEMRVPEMSPSFLKLMIPDPFELVEQLRGKLGSDAEFGTQPAFVPPARP